MFFGENNSAPAASPVVVMNSRLVFVISLAPRQELPITMPRKYAAVAADHFERSAQKRRIHVAIANPADQQQHQRAFTSTPASFSSALITAEAFSFPKPSATADSRFFWTARSAGIGDCKLPANFSMRSASLSISS